MHCICSVLCPVSQFTSILLFSADIESELHMHIITANVILRIQTQRCLIKMKLCFLWYASQEAFGNFSLIALFITVKRSSTS